MKAHDASSAGAIDCFRLYLSRSGALTPLEYSKMKRGMISRLLQSLYLTHCLPATSIYGKFSPNEVKQGSSGERKIDLDEHENIQWSP